MDLSYYRGTVCSRSGIFQAQAFVMFLQDGLIVSKRMDIVVGLDAQHGKGRHHECSASSAMISRLSSGHAVRPAMPQQTVLLSPRSEGVRTCLQASTWLHGGRLTQAEGTP